MKFRHQLFDNIFSTHVTHHSTQMSCKAAARLFARPYIRHATLTRVLVYFSTYVMPRRCTFPFISPHKSRIAAILHFHTHMLLRCCTLIWRFHIMLRCRTFCCTFPHTSCYVAARSVAFFHISHVMLPHVLLHFST